MTDDNSTEKPKSNKLIIIIAIISLILIAGGGAAFFMLAGGEEQLQAVEESDATDSGEKANKDENDTGDKEQKEDKDKQATKSHKKPKNAKGNMSDPAIYIAIRPAFIINFNNRGRNHYLQVMVDVMTRDPEIQNLVDEHNPRIKNDLITLFSSKELDQLISIEEREKLRQESLEAINKIMMEVAGWPGVEAVLFTSFVVQ